ncbi:MAG: ATP synthase subunit I [Clostridia bacterium]
MPDDPKDLVSFVEKRVLIIVGFLAVGFYIIQAQSWSLGIMLGGFASIMYLRAISVVAKTVIGTNEKIAKISTIASFAFRQLLTISLLGISFFRDEISFPAVVLGLLLVKIIIISKSVQEKWQDSLNQQIKNIRNKLERRN